MKKIFIVLVFASLCLARLSPIITNMETDKTNREHSHIQATRGTLIGPLGDIRGILGPQGKSIIVCKHGNVIAVIYGDRPYPPGNMEVSVVYSIDSGATWQPWGPFSPPELRRVYPGCDGSPNFCTNGGELYFIWQESPPGYNTGDLKVMIEESVPSFPSFSTPISLPGADTLFPWMPCIACAPDSPQHVFVSAWSYLNGGNGNIICWISDDGANSWTDPILMGDNLPAANTASPHVRYGTRGYAAATYHNLYNYGGDDIEWPYFIESTDGGIVWLPRIALPVPYVNPDSSQFWWHELDCEVINNEPWTVHTDLGTDSMWLFHGTGSPGNWTWEVFNVRQLGACSLTVADTLFYCYPSQYPNISYEPISNTILISYKAYFLKATAADTFYNGAHIGGIYSTDNGITWHISQPLSDANTGQIPWNNMVATEVAHRLVNINGEVYSYGIWANQTELNLYFDRGHVTRFYTGTTENYTDIPLSTNFKITPTISHGAFSAAFCLNKPEQVNIDLFDACGRLVEHVFDGYMQAGRYTKAFMHRNIADGPYFLVLNTSDHRNVVKVIFAK